MKSDTKKEMTPAVCTQCCGRGRIERYEYTPPFESFMSWCYACTGKGTVWVDRPSTK